ncbi:MAG TPA: ATP-binding protein [Candidatus Paceibacterota bacterium]
MIFQRKQDIKSQLEPKRVLLIYGPRRVGKTTMLEAYLKGVSGKKVYYGTGDDARLHEIFKPQYRKEILDFARPYDIIALDEAQYIPNIGIGAKMMIDAFPEKNIILTGSSSLNLSNKIGEPLTGRHFTLTLLPLSQREMNGSKFELKNNLEDFLLYGSYPEVLSEPDTQRKIKLLNEIVSSYLFKDVLMLETIRYPDLLRDVLKCLAFQVGNEVSLNEIAVTVKTDVKTVGRYVDLLEKMFIIKKVRGFSRNLRNEISKKSKYYFLDTGIRNAVISQFNGLSSRNDIGALWENFIAIEFIKKSLIENRLDTYYFWRTHTGQEIDIIKESNGVLSAFECKWSKNIVSPPPLWGKTYPSTSFTLIHRDNYLDFLLTKG